MPSSDFPFDQQFFDSFQGNEDVPLVIPPFIDDIFQFLKENSRHPALNYVDVLEAFQDGSSRPDNHVNDSRSLLNNFNVRFTGHNVLFCSAFKAALPLTRSVSVVRYL